MSAVISSEPINSLFKGEGESLMDAAVNWLRYTDLLMRQQSLGGLFTLDIDFALRGTVEDIRLLFPKRLPVEVSIRVGEIKTLLGEIPSRPSYGVGAWQGKTILEASQKWLDYVGVPTLETAHLWTRVTCTNFENAISEVRTLYPKNLPFEISERIRRIEAYIRRFEKLNPHRGYPKRECI